MTRLERDELNKCPVCYRGSRQADDDYVYAVVCISCHLKGNPPGPIGDPLTFIPIPFKDLGF